MGTGLTLREQNVRSHKPQGRVRLLAFRRSVSLAAICAIGGLVC